MNRRLPYLALGLFALSVVPVSAQTATISGTITDAGTMAPLGGDTFRVWVYKSDLSGGGSTTPDGSGHYSLGSLGAGTYFVRVTSEIGYVTELHDNLPCVASDCPTTAGTPVLLADGGSATINFALAPEGRIAGTVSRTGSGALVGATVVIYNASTSLGKSVTTNDTGAYVANGLAAGNYFVRVGNELYNDKPCFLSCMIAAGTPVTVSAGSTTSGIDIALPRGGSISGTVVSEGSMTPLSNVPVSVVQGELEVGRPTTNASGQFTIAFLSAGTYHLSPGGAVNPSTTVVVTDGADVGGITLSLPNTGGLSGRVNLPCFPNPVGLVLSAPQVEVYTSAGTSVGMAVSDPPMVPTMPPSGCPTFTFALSDLPAGQYYLVLRDTPGDPFNPFFASTGDLINELYDDIVCVTADCDVTRGTPVTVAAGAVTSGVTFDLVFGGSIGLIGSVMSGFVPLEIFDSRGVPLTFALRRNLFSFHQFVGLPPGTYFVKAGDTLYDGIACPACPPTSGTPIVIGPDWPDAVVTVDVASTRRLTGTVRDGSMTGLSTINVELYSASGQLMESVSSDVLGNYVFLTVAPGTYYLRTRNNRGFIDEAYSEIECAACDVRTGTAVTVAGADVVGIDFSLAPGGGIAGLVTDTTGFAVGGATVSVFTPTGELSATSITDALGQYRVTVPAGSFRARTEPSVTHGVEVYAEQPCTSASCDIAAGTSIAVTTGTTTPNINFTVPSCGALRLSPTSLATGVDTRTYRQVLSVSGGTGAMAFRVIDGVLPPGMALGASSGVIDGTPAVSGRYALTIGALDAAGCGTSRAYTLDIQECAFTLSPTSATVPVAGGTVTITIGDTCGPQTVTATSFVNVQSNTAGQVVLTVPPNPLSTARSNDLTIGRRVFTVRQAGLAVQPPFGALDAPTDGAQVSGSVAVGGWALDDLEVTQVQIFRDPVVGEPAAQIFIGTTVFVAGARPDVAKAYSTYPFNTRAGWGYLILTNMLPNQGNGTFRIYAYAEDAEGARALLGAKTIVVNNTSAAPPFGTIDTPAQGETIAGSGYLNWGWALTPQPKIIPIDGSTIQVYVDGVPQGNPVYNLFRPDVSGLFPGLENSGGPVGYRVLDTTALAEGQHTIAWVVADDQGSVNGIGSRYFSVANSADAQVQAVTGTATSAAELVRSVDRDRPEPSTIAVLPGPDAGRHVESLAKAALASGSILAARGDGVVRRLRARDGAARVVTLAPLERLLVTLGEADEPCAGTWAGYLVSGERLDDLPVGAAIDRTGTFYWQPGPGFIGTFELLFVRTACDGSQERLPIAVNIRQ